MFFNIQYTDQNLQSNTGLCIIAKLFQSIQPKTIFRAHCLSVNTAENYFSDRDILITCLALIATGNPHFEAIDLFKNDLFFRKALLLNNVPSKETLRQRMDKIAHQKEFIFDAFFKLNFKLLKKYAQPLPILNTNLIPVDFDVTVFDNTGSKKQGVEQSYRPKIKGFAPMMTNIGRQGYLLHHQFRKGNDHSNCPGTFEYILQTLNLARRLCPKQKLLARFDSGNDSEKNIVGLSNLKNTYFIVKHHLKGKNVKNAKNTLIQYVLNNYTAKKEFPNGTVRYFAEQPFIAAMYDEYDNFIQKSCRRIISVVELNNDINTGQPLLIPFRSIHFWRTNLPKSTFSPKKVINLYKDHGTSEQFHSEFKTDLDIERLPSAKFKTNQLFVAISQIVFNLLRIIGQRALKSIFLNPKQKYHRLKIRTVLLKIILFPARFMRKNKVWTIALPRSNPLAQLFHQLYFEF